MTTSFLGQVIGTAVASVLAVTALVGAHQSSPQAPGTSTPSRNPLADKVEGSARKLAREVELPVGHGVVGRDISWSNCPKGMGIPARRTLGKPLPPASARYVVIGLTNGPGFYPNPCLGEQVTYARGLHLWIGAYAVVTYPTGTELDRYGAAGPRSPDSLAGRLWNTGWAQAQANLTRMRTAGLDAPVLWLDVETVRPPAPWSPDVRANRTVLEGTMAAYRKAGLQLGVYSTAYLWRSVVGDVGYRLPEWRAAGATSRREALERCAHSPIQGGMPVIGQWSSVEEDFDVLCPGPPATSVLREYFTSS
jgi:hypothetical protein